MLHASAEMGSWQKKSRVAAEQLSERVQTLRRLWIVEQAREAIEAVGARVLYLLPYSPDFIVI